MPDERPSWVQDHPSNLECSGAGGSLLREKAILEELLQQERSKQLLSYSHNEDVRTSPSSGSQSSEPPGGAFPTRSGNLIGFIVDGGPSECLRSSGAFRRMSSCDYGTLKGG